MLNKTYFEGRLTFFLSVTPSNPGESVNTFYRNYYFNLYYLLYQKINISLYTNENNKLVNQNGIITLLFIVFVSIRHKLKIMNNFIKLKFLNKSNNLYDAIKYHHYFCKLTGFLAQSIVIRLATKSLVILKRDCVFVLWQICIICFSAINYTIFFKGSSHEIWMIRGFKATGFDIFLYNTVFTVAIVLQSINMLYFYFIRGRISYILNRSDELDNMMLRIKIGVDYNSSLKFSLIVNLYFLIFNIIIVYFHFALAENNVFIVINYLFINHFANAMISYISILFNDVKNKFKAMNLYTIKYSYSSPNKIKNVNIFGSSRNLQQELPEFLLIYKELNIYAKYVQDTFSFIFVLLVLCNLWSFVSKVYYSIVSIIQKNHWNEMKYVMLVAYFWNIFNALKIGFLFRSMIACTFEVSNILFH